jgi:hypothetical protein
MPCSHTAPSAFCGDRNVSDGAFCRAAAQLSMACGGKPSGRGASELMVTPLSGAPPLRRGTSDARSMPGVGARGAGGVAGWARPSCGRGSPQGCQSAARCLGAARRTHALCAARRPARSPAPRAAAAAARRAAPLRHARIRRRRRRCHGWLRHRPQASLHARHVRGGQERRLFIAAAARHRRRGTHTTTHTHAHAQSPRSRRALVHALLPADALRPSLRCRLAACACVST